MKNYFFAIICSMLMSFPAFSSNTFWGPTGHRTVAQIAERYLTNKAKRKIEKLLKYQSAAFVSTYPDDIKADKRYERFSPWHFVNLPLDESYETSTKNLKGDLITGINQSIKILKDEKSTAEEKCFYLKMLIHLVGDLHQPLHVGRKEDEGGNTIQVQWYGKNSNLHKVWDIDIINRWGMSYTELASSNNKPLPKEQVKEIQKGNTIDWLHDTHQLTRKVYLSAKAGENLEFRYSYLYFPIVRKQLEKGGIRLAKLLNELFN